MPPSAPPGRKRIAVIGIDRYRSWPALNNAVRDARGALRLFEYLGFEPVGEPLFDDAATGAAIHAFVTDELMALGQDDSLVLFFAGHGGTRHHWLGGEQLKTGYLIPADAACGDKVATWIDLDDWLRRIARLPPRHILVFVDACFAGIALSPIAKWRDSGTFQHTPLDSLQARRSRRIITSALDDQVALDSGPVPGHSLFTGCLIEGFQQRRLGHERGVVTGTEVGLYLQQRVGAYPASRQTPDFGTFELDDRGEMVIPLLAQAFDPEVTATRPPQTVSLSIATVSGPADDAGRRHVGARRWIAAAVAVASIALVSFVFVSSFVTEPSSPVEQPTRALEPRSMWVAPARDAIGEDKPVKHEGSDATAGSATGVIAEPSDGSAGGPKPGMSTPPASGASADAATVPAPGTRAVTVARSRGQSPSNMVPHTIVPTAIAPSMADSTATKPRVRAPRIRRVKPAVDERNCPVKGSQPVEIETYPPGATLYINHKGCGVLGKTPWDGTLPPSEGTATGTFTAIFERAGEEPVTKEFVVVKSRRIQRVEVRMRPKR